MTESLAMDVNRVASRSMRMLRLSVCLIVLTGVGVPLCAYACSLGFDANPAGREANPGQTGGALASSGAQSDCHGRSSRPDTGGTERERPAGHDCGPECEASALMPAVELPHDSGSLVHGIAALHRPTDIAISRPVRRSGARLEWHGPPRRHGILLLKSSFQI